jgi:hypothetical protein
MFLLIAILDRVTLLRCLLITKFEYCRYFIFGFGFKKSTKIIYLDSEPSFTVDFVLKNFVAQKGIYLFVLFLLYYLKGS